MKKSNNSLLLKYAGMTTQLFIALGLAVFFGTKVDSWVSLKTPTFVWVLPLIIIVGLLYKVVKDSSANK